MISGLTVREAIAQLQFCAKQRASTIALQLHSAAAKWRNVHGGDGFGQIVKVARADRGANMRRVLDVKTPKVRGGIKKIWKSNITITIEEGSQKTTVAKERRKVGKALEREKRGLPPVTRAAISWIPNDRAGYLARKRRSQWADKASSSVDEED